MAEFWNSPLGVVLGFAAGSVPIWILGWFLSYRDGRYWQRRVAEDKRRWELERQVWRMEQQILEEQLPEEAREARRRSRARAADIRREARRRLGLPEEEAH
jgi:hypothetical protein